jgi:lipid-A-disaccharide synthase-like uncharacterized protein
MKYLIGIVAIGGALFMAVPGGIVLWMGLRSVWHGLASSHWPTVVGVVLRAGMTEDQAKGVSTKNTYKFYSTKLEFRYQIDGRDYTTETVQFGRAIGSGDISNEAVLALRYPAGTKATVFYHPHDPALAVVKPGVHTDVAWYLCGGAALILFGVFVVLGYLATERDLAFTTYIMPLFWVFFMLFGVAILAPGLRNLWYAKASQAWPTTDGMVIFAEEEATDQVPQDSEGRTGQFTTHGAPLAYQYEVNGTRYFSNVRHFGQFIGSSSQDWAEAILQRYPSGTAVPVSYCPDDPDLAALEPGINSESYYLPGGGLAFLLFGIAGMLWTILRCRGS